MIQKTAGEGSENGHCTLGKGQAKPLRGKMHIMLGRKSGIRGVLVTNIGPGRKKQAVDSFGSSGGGAERGKVQQAQNRKER